MDEEDEGRRCPTAMVGGARLGRQMAPHDLKLPVGVGERAREVVVLWVGIGVIWLESAGFWLPPAVLPELGMNGKKA